ncbi:MAG TPA: L-histidine N(alpha)-methyltransferase [Nitrospinae bacterium]|nr:L-histidine N(alpha)-methyltransferase [Nitrospinota bacterium]
MLRALWYPPPIQACFSRLREVFCAPERRAPRQRQDTGRRRDAPGCVYSKKGFSSAGAASQARGVFFKGFHVESGESIRLVNYEPTVASFLEEARAGLAKPQKTLPCKFFYDERGSELFVRICELDEYYLTRTEISIMRAHALEMGKAIGPGCALIEYGIGSALKTRILLDHLKNPAACIPVDISRSYLLRSASELARDFPAIEILPVCANFSEPFEVPETRRELERAVAYFPGSTIGNLSPAEAAALLGNMAATCGSGGGLLIGIDLIKDTALLEAAYNDSQGVTAAFNKNILVRMNRELGANFDLEKFDHLAFYNEAERRVESHLVSRANQRVRLGEEEFAFQEGETIHSENSQKYDIEDFSAFAAGCGFRREGVWTDARDMFAVLFLSLE